ncbi:MAG: hypothetical protein Q7R41_03075 [Phycisphaerales bacterium]|nr:hypothetical protein [Phycisphaerales bacterium]
MAENTSGEAAIAAALEASTVAIRAAHDASEASREAALVAAKTAADAMASARAKNWWQTTAQIGVWVVLVLLAYGTVNTRLQVLEVKYDRIAEDITEMRADVKLLLLQQQQILVKQQEVALR